MSSELQEAIRQAQLAHLGQLDKGGVAFIGHPLRVMAVMAAKDAPEHIVSAAVLHDVFEDTSITRGVLGAEGISDEVLDIVEALTRGPDENYVDYIVRVSENVDARWIKQSDIRDNMDPTRTHAISASMYKRYAEALRLLQVKDQNEGLAPR
jgi:(p)ppGpp synthase/HD superfamily hydrolase